MPTYGLRHDTKSLTAHDACRHFDYTALNVMVRVLMVPTVAFVIALIHVLAQSYSANSVHGCTYTWLHSQACFLLPKGMNMNVVFNFGMNIYTSKHYSASFINSTVDYELGKDLCN